SLTHPYTGHSNGHMVMLSGRTPMPPGFDASKPLPSDWPAIASVAQQLLPRQNNLPPAVVLPELLIHREGRVIPGQFGGGMGPQWQPWLSNAFAYNSVSYGAYPEYGFHFERGNENPKNWKFEAPSLMLPEGVTRDGLAHRMELLGILEDQLSDLDRHARVNGFDRHRQQALSLLADPKVRPGIALVAAQP